MKLSQVYQEKKTFNESLSKERERAPSHSFVRCCDCCFRRIQAAQGARLGRQGWDGGLSLAPSGTG